MENHQTSKMSPDSTAGISIVRYSAALVVVEFILLSQEIQHMDQILYSKMEMSWVELL